MKFEEFDLKIIIIDFGDKNDLDEVDCLFFEILGDGEEDEVVF